MDVATTEPAGKAKKKKKKKKEKEKKLHGDEANGQYNAKWLLSLVYVSKPLITKVTAVEPSFRTDCFSFLSLSFFFFCRRELDVLPNQDRSPAPGKPTVDVFL